MSTVYEVASRAGVSTATVSRVVHGSALVHPDTRDRVLAVIEELGYVPDGSAQGLSRRRKDIIGLAGLERGVTEVGIEKTSPLFMDELVHAVEAVLRGTDCSLLLTFGRAGEPFQRRIRSLSGKVDGLLIAEEVMPPAQLRALARRIPVVSIAGRRGEPGLDVVSVDNTAGIRALAGHLMGDHGYRRVGFLAGPADSPDARDRLAAMSRSVAGYPGSVLDPVLDGDFSEASGAAAARRLLDAGRLPDAIACANDQMAIGLLLALQQRGVAVPGDVAVTGFDDIYASRVVTPALTTVGQPFRELGHRAAQRLRARIEDRELAPRTEVLPTQCQVRASCGCPAPATP
jgi:LacI family transcriptional regulator, galactose operon repressor